MLRQSVPHSYYHPTPTAKKVKNYTFSSQQLIGKGYTSTVYKAVNQFSRQTVAVKIIDLTFLRDQVMKNMLEAEIQCLSTINHPNLLRLVESFETMNNYYLVTEYCEQGDLEKMLHQRGKFAETQMMDIFWQVLQGYEHLNKCGYIHRDLKLANIFCQGRTMKIGDFGFVRKLYKNPKDLYNVGTTKYMAPESISANIYSEKSDIWSLGVICYQLLFGCSPWHSTNEEQLKKQICLNKVCIGHNLMLSFQLHDFLTCCLQKNITKRMGMKQVWRHPWVLKISQKYMSNIESEKMMDRCHKILENPTKHHRNFTQTILMTPFNDKYIRKSEKLMKGKSENKENKCIKFNQIISNTKASTQKFPFKTIQPNIHHSKPVLHHIKQSVISLANIPTQITSKTNSQVVLQKLIIILNFFRFQYKIYEFISQSTSLKQRSALMELVLRVLIQNFKDHLTIVNTGQNKFQLEDWEQFLKSEKWGKYQKAIRQYSQKFNRSYEGLFPSYYSTIKQYLDQVNLQNCFNLSEQSFKQVQCLTYLQTIEEVYETLGVSQNNWKPYLKNYSQIAAQISEKKSVTPANHASIVDQLLAKHKSRQAYQAY